MGLGAEATNNFVDRLRQLQRRFLKRKEREDRKGRRKASHLRVGSRFRAAERLRASILVASRLILKHKGHEGPQRGPQSIASESGTSVPERHAIFGVDGYSFNGLFETRRTRRSTKTPQRSDFDSSQRHVCLQSRRESGSRNAMLRGPFVVLSVLCVSKPDRHG